MANSDTYMKARRAARLAAVQALYQMDLTGDKSALVVRDFNSHWFALEKDTDVDNSYFELLVLGVVTEQASIDQAAVSKLSKDWQLGRLDMTLRAILRCAIFELLSQKDIPALVIIDQYVGIAGDFYENTEPGFVNAALDKLAREVRPIEFGASQVQNG